MNVNNIASVGCEKQKYGNFLEVFTKEYASNEILTKVLRLLF